MAAPVVLGVTIRIDGAGQATAQLNQLNQAVNNSGTAAQNTNRQFAAMARETFSLNNVMGAFGVTLGLVGLVAFSRDMVKTIETIQNMDLRLKGLTKSTQDYAEVQNYLATLSQQHHKDQLVLADSLSRLLSVEETGIITRQQSKAILEGLSNAQSKTGATSENLSQSMTGLTQALSSGTLQWEEMKQVTEPIPGLMTKIAEAAGYTGQSAVGDFKKVVSEGQVTSDMFGRILAGALAQYQGAAEAAGDSLTAKYADISNAWTELARVLEEPVSDALTPVLEAISSSIMNLIADAKELGVALDFIFTQKWNAENLAAADAQMSAIAKKYRSDANTGGATGSWDDGKTGSWGDTSGAAEAAAIRKEIDANASTKTKAAVKHQQASRAIAKSINEEENAAKALASAYDSTMKSLQLRNAELSQTPRNYQIATLEAKNFTHEMIAQAMRIYDVNVAWEAKNKAQEAEKSSMDALIDKYNQLTLSARDYYSLTLTNSGIAPEKQAPMLAQFDKNADAEKQKQAIDDSTQSLRSYIQSIDSANDKTTDLGAVTSAVFDGALGGINTLVGAFSKMADAIDSNSQLMAENQKQQIENVNNIKISEDERHFNKVKLLAEEQDLTKKNALISLSGVRQMAGATASMFKENSTARKTMHAIEVSLGAVEMAMQIKSLAAKGAAAVLNQGDGDPYTAFARIAAMTAIVGGIIAAAGGAFSSGGGATVSEAQISAAKGAGTVLGDKDMPSDSINKTYDLLKSIHAEEYAELRGINSGIKSLQSGITDTVARSFQGGGMQSADLSGASRLSSSAKNAEIAVMATQAIMAPMTLGISLVASKIPILGDAISKVTDWIAGGLFGKISKNVIATGIATGSTSVNSVLSGSGINAQRADMVVTTKDSWFKTSYKYDLQLSALDKKISSSLDNVFYNMGNTMLYLAKQLGGDLENKLRNYIIPSISVDLKGLSGEDASKKLNALISSTMDNMATTVFGAIIGQYQKLGEGMLETAVRIVSEVAVVKDALSVSGLSLSSNAIAISDALIQAAGSIEEFQKQFESYYDKFYSETEKQLRLQGQMYAQLLEVDLVLPQTREGYRKLIEALNLSNSKDQERYSLLISLSSAADSYYSMLETETKRFADAVSTAQDALTNARNDLTRANDNLTKAQEDSLKVNESLLSAYEAEKKAVQELALARANAVLDAYRIQEEAVTTAKDKLLEAYRSEADALNTTISKFNAFSVSLKSFRDSLAVGDLANGSNNYQASKGLFDSNAALISKGPGSSSDSNNAFSDAIGSFQANAQNYLSASLSNAVSATDYARDYAKVLNAIDLGIKISDTTKSNADLQLASLETSVSELVKINESVLTVHDAIVGVQAAVVALNKLQADRDTAAKIAEEAAARASAVRVAEEAAAKASAARVAEEQRAILQALQAAQSLQAAQAAQAQAAAQAQQAAQNLAAAQAAQAQAAAQAQQAQAAAQAQLAAQQAAQAAQQAPPAPSIPSGDQAYSWIEAWKNRINLFRAGMVSNAQVQQWLSMENDKGRQDVSTLYNGGTLKGYAKGGFHSGGWRVVGEDGPELENTGPSQIFSNSKSKSILSFDELIAEMKRLREVTEKMREEMKIGQAAIAANSKETTKQLKNWDIDGMPVERTV